MIAEARTHKVFAWLDRARADLAAARQDHRDGAHRPYHACFWAQQAAEKA
ncbi:MAG: HEPN domain-containing protein, partial [Chloroflexota bacterium]